MKNDPKLIAMVAAILSGFKNDITVNINVRSKNGENATISVYEFTKDEAGRFGRCSSEELHRKDF